MKQKFAVQLYTLREECQADFPALLRQLKHMGWSGVQFAGFHGYDPAELAGIMEETGLQTAGLHVTYQRIEEDLEQLIEEARLFRTRDLICSSTPPDLRNPEGYLQVRKGLNTSAGRLAEVGIRLSYHNHAFEFEAMANGRSGAELLLSPGTDNLFLTEPDVYWIKKAGYDPASFISRYSGRIPIIHLKDMTKDEEETFAEIGEGRLDFIPILKWGESNGIEWYVVEQDRCSRSPLDCIQTSITNLYGMVAETGGAICG
ncbi:sugar phosphate isomerase/epimerase [Paenibacillus sp. S150]|uniref:sugar phosphate isomerase/epimerase family protein n=1 Tax=Paenibacillus sp. S150 TaxID=2749826 RepID=UPI001C599616|nr:sugar phosphate isomerase/epimerase [Paenibacillus sp. S150]MBW4084392.1 sugar phosphate isomerase/epimerase [Paenibacillus sp. S150]